MAETANQTGIETRILFEDNHLIAVSKQCGEISQGDKTGDLSLGDVIAHYIKVRDEKPGNVFLVPVHRLDRPVSGVSLFARTSKANSRMNELFRKGCVEKRYLAIISGRPPVVSGTLIHYLVRKPAKNKSFAYDAPSVGAKRSELHYRIVAASDRYALLEITMHSGRHHQIRAQLAAAGLPIRGDLKYGFPRSNPGGGISLHARAIAFDHPVGKGPVEIVAPLPEGDVLWDVFGEMLDNAQGNA